jgi:phosphoenolpyruvate---glycerone phosphotransferase subunit DhaK
VKKLLNRPEAVTDEALEGLVLAHGGLLRLLRHNIVVRRDAPVQGKVAVVSGGGSGHEPMHTGFVGHGMLDAACPGPVFTAPAPEQILAATRAVSGGAGVLYVVKNYSGDVMAFEAAEELAAGEGIPVRSVRVCDDVAVDEGDGTPGRRGVAGTMLVHKIAGAVAQAGADLDAVERVAARAASSVRSMGVALSGCTIPAVGRPGFSLAANEMEIGIGIHGERGRARVPMLPADDVVGLLMEPILSDMGLDRDDTVLAFVNGMGGTPLIELYVVYRAVARFLADRGIRAVRSVVGPYVTSMEMVGCSISIMKMDDELLRLWDAPVWTPAFRWGA